MSAIMKIEQSSEESNAGLCIIKDFRNFPNLARSFPGAYTASPIFYTGQYSWTLEIFCSGYDHNYKNYIGIGFYLTNALTMDVAGLFDSRFTVSIIGKDGKTYSTKSALFVDESSRYIAFKDFVLRQDLLNNPNLLPNGELTISFEVTFGASNSGKVTTSSQKSLPEYLGIVFDAGKYTDFKFVVEGKTFNVHRAILAARSPVFEAMFDSQMRESNEGKVKIEDVEARVMEKLLRFLYTSELEDMKDVADKVFVAAEKYQIDELKEKCENALIKQLSVTNVYYYLRLADENDGVQLKMKAMDFFHDNAKTLTADADFKVFVDSLLGNLKTDIIYLLMTKL